MSPTPPCHPPLWTDEYRPPATIHMYTLQGHYTVMTDAHLLHIAPPSGGKLHTATSAEWRQTSHRNDRPMAVNSAHFAVVAVKRHCTDVSLHDQLSGCAATIEAARDGPARAADTARPPSSSINC